MLKNKIILSAEVMRKLMIIAVLSALLIPNFGCGKKFVNGALVYEGPMDGDYVSKPLMLDYWFEMTKCMELSETPDYPALKVHEGSAVECEGKVRRGCYKPGIITLPVTTSSHAIKQGMIRHILWSATGEVDTEHSYGWLSKCSGLEITD